MVLSALRPSLHGVLTVSTRGPFLLITTITQTVSPHLFPLPVGSKFDTHFRDRCSGDNSFGDHCSGYRCSTAEFLYTNYINRISNIDPGRNAIFKPKTTCSLKHNKKLTFLTTLSFCVYGLAEEKKTGLRLPDLLK